MDAETFLRDELLGIPQEWDGGDFADHVRGLFDRFKELIGQVSGTDLLSQKLISRRDQSLSLCDGIVAAIVEYLAGFPHRAYDRLRCVLQDIAPTLGRFARGFDGSDPLKALYRVRIGTGTEYTKSDLFHVPFQDRHKVKTQRFSISGLPCLYLSGSLYVCWEEMGRPDFNMINMSRYTASPSSNIRMVNLGYRPQVFLIIIDRDRSTLNNDNFTSLCSDYMSLWPLVASCHVRVKHPSGDFKPEYVVPQILLQWVRDSDSYEGVIYTTTRIKETWSLPEAQMNFAFPARVSQAHGHCRHLLKEFELTQPVSWQIASTFRPGALTTALPHTTTSYTFMFEPIKDVKEHYHLTTWGDMESKLRSLKCACL